MLHNPNDRVHEDGQKGQSLAFVLQHYGLIDSTSLSDTFKIVCPLHEDINASMQVDLTRGIYYCYGCGKSGEAIDLIKEVEQVNKLKAYILLEKVLNRQIGKKVLIVAQPKETPKVLMEQAKLYFYSLQRTSWKDIRSSYMHKRGFDSKVLTKAGVRLNQNADYGVAMPMMEMGKFKGYVLRATSDSANQDRKYLYNKGFSRRNTLVGDYDYNFVVVVEGYLDWLKFLQFGKSNCVAILGWKATDQQIAKIKQYTTTIISALDNTPTGERGTRHLIDKGFDVTRFQFQDTIKDPGEMDRFSFNKAWADTIKIMKERKRGNKNG